MRKPLVIPTEMHMPAPRFRFLTGDGNWSEYGGKWISQPMHNGDHPFWYVVELMNMQDACGDDAEEKYYVDLSVVMPDAASAEERASVLRSCAWDGMDTADPLQLVEAFHSHGTKAHIWIASGNSYRPLMTQAREEARIANSFTFGCRMDSAQNPYGTTGWDAVKGDIMAPLRRLSGAEGSPEQNLVKRISGIE